MQEDFDEDDLDALSDDGGDSDDDFGAKKKKGKGGAPAKRKKASAGPGGASSSSQLGAPMAPTPVAAPAQAATAGGADEKRHACNSEPARSFIMYIMPEPPPPLTGSEWL